MITADISGNQTLQIKMHEEDDNLFEDDSDPG
jgi:hypothetical protein